ncbi:MAG: hypothetical protein WCD18_02535 [Thermosynechococcaceae cyanobacterium]
MTKSLAWKTLGWQWLLACVAAKLLQILLDGLAGWLVSTTGSGGSTVENSIFLLILIVFRLISGALGGAAQWLVLKSWLPSMQSWVLATSLGSAIAFFISNRLGSATRIPPPEGIMGDLWPSVSVLPPFIFGGIVGLVLGIAQWLVFRTKLPQAQWWIPLSSLGMLGEAIVVGALQSAIGPQGIDVSVSAFNPVYWAIAAISVVVYAALTGGFLVRCLRQRS